MSETKVQGKNKGAIKMFTLSTCIWCKRTKQFLADQGIEYSYIDLDMLDGEEKEKALEELKKWNERCSFPTLVINNEKCIVGFKEDEIKEAVGL
ncbi:MAG: glutaredoxin family protein [bacterium]